MNGIFPCAAILQEFIGCRLITPKRFNFNFSYTTLNLTKFKCTITSGSVAISISMQVSRHVDSRY